MTTVLICGGRLYGKKWLGTRLVKDLDAVMFFHTTMNQLHAERKFKKVIHGAAPGADMLAEAWAVEHRVPVDAYRAEWELFGRRAGQLRNRQMLQVGRPGLVVAFKGNAGTDNMVMQAHKAYVETILTWEL